MGLQKAKKFIRGENDLTVTGLCRGGFFTAKDWRDDNRRAIEEAHELGAQCLVLVVGGLPPGSKDLIGARNQVRDGIAAILPGGARGRRAARHRAAAPDAGRRARVHQHARAGPQPVRHPRRGPGRRGRRLSRVVGPEAAKPDRARGQAAPARVPHLRLALADARPGERPRHDGRRRNQFAPDQALDRKGGIRRAFRRSRFFPSSTGGSATRTKCSRTCKERLPQC